MTFIERAAHVGHGVEHVSDFIPLSLSLVGVVVGGAIAVGTGGSAAVVVGAICAWGGVGLNVGQMLAEGFKATSIAEHLATGLDTVRLGPALKPAVRAHDDSRPDGCTGDHVFEGSTSVMLGPERKPMGRCQDRTSCDGRIVEGIDSIFVGGDSSGEGIELAEHTSTPIRILSTVFAVGSLGSSLAREGFEKVVKDVVVGEMKDRVIETAVGEDAADVIGVWRDVYGLVPGEVAPKK